MTTSPNSYALVTAGGTSVYLDRTSKIKSEAKGAFGVAIATSLVEQGIKVILVCTEETRRTYPLCEGIEVVTYDTYHEYVEQIDAVLARSGQPTFAFSSASVSDFEPRDQVEGKYSFDTSAAIPCKSLPRVLSSWRELFGRKCYLVGYKLCDPLKSVADLMRSAQDQNETDHLNLTVASFQSESKKHGRHRTVYLVKPDGGHLTFSGTLSDVSHRLVEFSIRQSKTTWKRSERAGSLQAFVDAHSLKGNNCPAFKIAPAVLQLAQRANLLKGKPGNVVAFNLNPRFLLVTPRGHTNKELLDEMDFVGVDQERVRSNLTYWSEDNVSKPSIDAFTYMRVFERIRDITSAIHFHNGWVLDASETRMDYPCGTAEEASMILEALARATLLSAKDTRCPPWRLVRLIRHGYILFLGDDPYALSTLENAVSDMEENFSHHLKDIGMGEILADLEMTPIFGKNGTIIGIASRHRMEGWYQFFVDEVHRHKHYGNELIKLIIERELRVAVHNDCKVELFYRNHGFKVRERRNNGVTILESPKASDLIQLVTMTIRCATTGRYLQVKPVESNVFANTWSNPVGVVQADETPWETAVRVVTDDIGFEFNHPPEPEQNRQQVIYCSELSKDATLDRQYVVRSFQVDVIDEFVPFPDPNIFQETEWKTSIDVRITGLVNRCTREAVREHDKFIKVLTQTIRT